MILELYLKYINEQRKIKYNDFKKSLQDKNFIRWGSDLKWHITEEGKTFLNKEILVSLNEKEIEPITSIDPRIMPDAIRGLLNDKYIDYRLTTDEISNCER
jgi:hypothetical protein